MNLTSALFHQKTLPPKTVRRGPAYKILTFLGLIVACHMLAWLVHAVTVTEVTPYTIPSGITRENAQFTVDGYVIYKVGIYKQDLNSDYVSAITLNFVDIFSTNHSITIGSVEAYQFYEAIVEGSLVKRVYLCNKGEGTIALKFIYADNTEIKLPPTMDYGNCSDQSYTVPSSGDLQGPIRGLAFQRTNSGTQYRIEYQTWSFFIENAATGSCSTTQIPSQTITPMVVIIGAGATTKSFAAFKQNSYATSISNPSACGTTYTFSFDPMLPNFLIFENDVLTGQTSDLTYIGVQDIQITVELVGQPTATLTQQLELEVKCVLQPPTFSENSYTIEIGISQNPYNISFQQTQSCGVSPSLTVNPTTLSSKLSLQNDLKQVLIEGVTLAEIKSYTLTLTYTYELTSQSALLTLIIRDPCSRAVFKTTPSPFSTITFSAPSTASTYTLFKVYTDVEETYPSIICPISAIITGVGYVPVSINGAFTAIRLDGYAVSLPGDIGTHPITVEISSRDYTSVSFVTFTFDVVISCTVSTFTISATNATDSIYTKGSNSMTKGPITAVQQPACNWPVTWRNELYLNNVYQGDAHNFNGSTKTFGFLHEVVGVHKHVLTYTISPTGETPKTAVFELTVTVQLDCANTSFVDRTFDNMTINVLESTSQNIQFADTVANTAGSPAACGPRIYTFAGGMPSFLSIDPMKTTLTLATNNVSDVVNNLQITFTVTLENYPSVAPQSETFSVTIQCFVQSLTFTSPPTTMIIEAGDTNSQPQTQTLLITQYPNCGSNVCCGQTPLSFQFTTPTPAFVTMTSEGVVTVAGASIANIGVYPLSIRAQKGDKTADTSLRVEISDLCKRAVFLDDPRPINMKLIRNFDQNQIQTFVPKTDIERDYGVVCSYSDTLINQLAFVTMAGTKITVFAELATSNQVGDINIEVQVRLAAQSTTVKTYTFILTVENCIASQVNFPSINDFTVKINQMPAILTLLAAATWSNLACICQINYTALKDQSPLPPWLTFNAAERTLRVDSTDLQNVGEHLLVLQTRIHSSDMSTLIPDTKSFKLTILCEVTSIQVDKSPPLRTKYRIKIDKPLLLEFQFTETPFFGLVYSQEPTFPFVTLINADRIIQVHSTDFKHTGIHKLKLTAAPTSQCFGVTREFEFEVELLNICETTNFYSQVIPDINVFRQDPDFKANQVIKFEDFQYEALFIDKLDCGPVKTELKVFNSTQSTPDWIKMSEGSIFLEFSTLEQPQSVKLNLVTYLEQYPSRKTTSSFQVKLSGSFLTCSQNMPQEYFMGSPPLQFGIDFKNETQTFGMKLTPTINALAFDAFGASIPLPSFVKFDEQLSKFQISKITQQDFGQYNVGLMLGYREYADFAVICKTKLNLTYKPWFEAKEGKEIAQTQLICGKPWSVNIPEFMDSFGKTAETSINLGEAKEFLTYSPESRNITTGDFDTTNLKSSSFTVEMTNTDSMMNSKSQKLTFETLCFQGINEPSKVNPQQTKVKGEKSSPPRPYIESVSQFGRVRVAFTKPVTLPTFTIYSEFTDQKLMRQNCTNTTQHSDLCIDHLKERRMLSKKTLAKETQEAVEIVNRGLVFVNNTFKPILNLTMLAGIESDRRQLNMTWSCQDFKPTHMDFSVRFESYPNVSIHDNKDRLQVNIHGLQYFRSADNNEQIEASVIVLEKTVPPQMDPENSKNLILAAQAVNSVSKAVIVGQFLMNLFVGSAIQQLFSSIRKLTIMVHLLIINVRIPANAQLFFGVLLQFVTFNIIDLEPTIRKTLNLYENKEIQDNLLNLGYVSNYFIINMGNVFIVMIYLVALVICYACTQRTKNQRFLQIRNYLTQGLFWNTILSFFTESYLLMAISSITNLRIFKHTSVGTVLSGNLAIIGAFVLIGLPIFVLFFLQNKSKKLHLASYRNKYGKIYEELSYKRKGKAALMEPFISLMRVLLLTLSLLLLKEYRYFQLFSSNFLMTTMIIYVGLSNCYTSKTKSFFEQFNEVFIAITNYHLMCFADFIQDERTRNLFGWSMVACVGFNLIVNLGFIMIGSVKDAYSKLRKRYYLFRIKSLKKRITANEAKQKARIADQIARGSSSGHIQQVFPNKRVSFLIEQQVRLDYPSDADSSMSNLVSNTNNQRPSVSQFTKNSEVTPKLLPGQIEFKPSLGNKNLHFKTKIPSTIANEDQKEQKIPTPTRTKSLNAEITAKISNEDLEEEKLPSLTIKQSVSVMAQARASNQDFKEENLPRLLKSRTNKFKPKVKTENASAKRIVPQQHENAFVLAQQPQQTNETHHKHKNARSEVAVSALNHPEQDDVAEEDWFTRMRPQILDQMPPKLLDEDKIPKMLHVKPNHINYSQREKGLPLGLQHLSWKDYSTPQAVLDIEEKILELKRKGLDFRFEKMFLEHLKAEHSDQLRAASKPFKVNVRGLSSIQQALDSTQPIQNTKTQIGQQPITSQQVFDPFLCMNNAYHTRIVHKDNKEYQLSWKNGFQQQKN